MKKLSYPLTVLFSVALVSIAASYANNQAKQTQQAQHLSPQTSQAATS